eukprot:6440032-Prorocentrum_lima.AAC.1
MSPAPEVQAKQGAVHCGRTQSPRHWSCMAKANTLPRHDPDVLPLKPPDAHPPAHLCSISKHRTCWGHYSSILG